MSVFKNAFVSSLWIWLEVTSKNLLVFLTFLTCVFGFGDESMPFIVARGEKKNSSKIKIGVSTIKTSKVEAVSLSVWARDIYLKTGVVWRQDSGEAGSGQKPTVP